ncbi:MAG: hypothetical protein WAK96_06790 [Desulfobaccales bacterium]
MEENKELLERVKKLLEDFLPKMTNQDEINQQFLGGLEEQKKEINKIKEAFKQIENILEERKKEISKLEGMMKEILNNIRKLNKLIKPKGNKPWLQ